MRKTSILPLSFLALVCCGSSAHGDDCSIHYPKELAQVIDEPGTCEISLSSGAWSGYLNGALSVGHCPQGYCYYNESARIGISTSDLNTTLIDLDKMICSPMNRKGVLCGKCLPGYGHAINSKSYPCISCTDEDKTRNWVYYVLAIYVPIVAMFLIILLCDVRLTTGAFNAFILFGQVISAQVFLSSSAQPTSVDATKFQDAYLIPYSVLNLKIIGNILPNFCLSSDLNSLDVISLKLLEASTPLLTIIVVIVILKFQVRLKCNERQLCRKRINFVHAFDAFIVLSYSRFCDVVSTLVDPGHVWGVNGTVVSVRVYENGEYEYYGKEFLPYKAVGFTATAILCVIPLLLLQYPLQWLEYMCAKTKKTWYPSVQICTILDVFQGCYKDNRRYFAGLYLILRLLLNFSPLLTIKPDQYLMQQTTLVVFIMLLGILKPYKIKLYNYIDIMILTNLLLIGLTNGYQLALYEGAMKPSILVFAFQQVLIWLPLACYVLYGTWKAMTILKTSGWYIKCCNWFKALHQKKDTTVPPIKEPITDDTFEMMFLRDADKLKRNANVANVV